MGLFSGGWGFPENGLPRQFDGWPRCRKIDDPRNEGRAGIEVRANYLTPQMAQVAQYCAFLLGLAMFTDMAILAMTINSLDFAVGAALLALIVWLAGRWFFTWVFSHTLWIRMFEDRLMVAGWTDYRSYDVRGMDYTFHTDEHEEAPVEEISWRQNPKMRRWYTDCKYVNLRHGRQSMPLACVYPAKAAEALSSRLCAVVEGFSLNLFQQRD